jgi:homoserine acetyltransferase
MVLLESLIGLNQHPGSGFVIPNAVRNPFHGPRFPVTSIRDNVEALHRLLAEDLRIKHVRAMLLDWACSRNSSGR